MILTHHCSCMIISLSCYFFTTLKFTCQVKNMSRQGSKRLNPLEVLHTAVRSHIMKIQVKAGICHTHIYNLIESRHKGCCFTPFIYLVRIELESMRLSKHVSMCTCVHYEALVTITYFFMWQGLLLCPNNHIYILYSGI